MTQDELKKCITSIQVINGNTYTTYKKPANATYEELEQAVQSIPSSK